MSADEPAVVARRLRVLDLPSGGWVRANEIASVESFDGAALTVWLRGGCCLCLSFDDDASALDWMKAARP